MAFSFSFNGMNTLRDPASFPIKRTDQGSVIEDCLEMVNCFADDEGNSLRRGGYTMTLPNDAGTQAWGNDRVAYFDRGLMLCFFDGTPDLFVPVQKITGQVVSDFLSNPPYSFVEVNDLIYFSDGIQLGYLEGAVATMIPLDQETPGVSDWTAVNDLAAWVDSHYPRGLDNPPSNLEVDTFSLPAFGGKCLEFYNGTVYIAKDNILYCTKAMNAEHMDIRYNVVAGYPHPITMVRRVVDGLYIGTTKKTYFLRGDGFCFDEKGALSGGFTQEQLYGTGVHHGTDICVDADKVAIAQMSNEIILWASPGGLIAGGAGGKTRNLSQGIVQFPEIEAEMLIAPMRVPPPPSGGFGGIEDIRPPPHAYSGNGMFPALIAGHTYTFSGLYHDTVAPNSFLLYASDILQTELYGGVAPTPFSHTFTASNTTQINLQIWGDTNVFGGLSLVDTTGGCAFFHSSNGVFQYVGCIGTETWVVNATTGAHSRYTNFRFSSFFILNQRYFGVLYKQGVFELVGETDNGTLIDAYSLTPSTNFGKSKLKRARAAYVYARANNALVLDIYVDETLVVSNLPVISTDATGVHCQRVKVPRSLKGTAMQFKIKNTVGKPFTLLSLDIDTVVLTRTT